MKFNLFASSWRINRILAQPESAEPVLALDDGITGKGSGDPITFA